MIKLYQKVKGYRPLYLDLKGKTYKLGGFKVYDNNGVIVENNRGFFEDIKEITFNFDITRKIKESFNKKEAYILKDNSNKFFNDDIEYILYIHKDLLNLSDPQYKREFNFIKKYYNTNIPGLKFEVLVKQIDGDLYQIKREIEKSAEQLRSYKLNYNLLDDIIEDLKILGEKLKHEEIKVKNYKVDDYLKEIENN